MTLTLTSYMGVEIIGVTAGEAAHPKKPSLAHAYRVPSAHSFLRALDNRDALDDAMGQDGQRYNR